MIGTNIIPLLFMVNNAIFNKDDDEDCPNEFDNDEKNADTDQEISCYIGTDMAAWNTSIRAIIKANLELFLF